MVGKVLTSLNERLVVGRSALLVVDMQNDFCADGGYVSRLGRDVRCFSDLAPRVQKLVADARSAGVPVIWLMAEYDQEFIPRPMLARQLANPAAGVCCGAGSWGAQPFGVTPAPGEAVIVKHCYSGFHRTGLAARLRRLKVDTLVFAGVQTNVCVESTLRDGHSLGYYPVVAKDCVLSHMLSEHEATLNTVSFLFGDVVASGAIAELWAQRAAKTVRKTEQDREPSS